MPTGEGSKKSEPDKLEHIMMLHKALDNSDMMYDMIHDLKFMESNLKMVDIPYTNPDIAAALAHATSASSVLNVVMNPISSSASTNMMPGSGKSIYVPVLQSYNQMTPSLPKLQPIGEYSQGPGPSKYQAIMPMKALDSKPQVSSDSSAAGGSKTDNDGLRLLLSPWQQMMYVPPQQAIVIDRMHSGARRFVVLDFGAPVLLTDMIIPSCNDLVSLSIDIWVHREDTDGQRLVVATDIGVRTLVVSDLQPPAICRYLKVIFPCLV
jgi:baculoviral IAP repeat-containing protein 6